MNQKIILEKHAWVFCMTAIMLLTLVLFAMPRQVQAAITVSSTDTPVTIASVDGGAPVTSTISFPVSGSITNANVEMDLNVNICGADPLTLTGPGGRTITIMSGVNHNAGRIFARVDDDAFVSMEGECLNGCGSDGAPARGYPEIGKMENFNGQVSDASDWTLSLGTWTGGCGPWTINSWSLILEVNLPSVGLSVSTASGTEVDTTAVTVTATASSNVIGDQNVDVVVSGTGITGSDYTLSNSTITIPDGTNSGSVVFQVADDVAAEGNETAVLTIVSHSLGIKLGSPASRSIAITDDDVWWVNPSAGGGGSINPPTSQWVAKGTGNVFTIIPAAGYSVITPVGGSCGGTFSGDQYDTTTGITYTTSAVTADCTVAASFAINTYALTYSAGSGGSISGTTSQTVNYLENGSMVTAVPNSGYSFISWSDGVTTTSRTDLNVIADLNVTANFSINTYALTYTAGSGGSISGSTLQTINYLGNGSTVTAVPDSGYSFISWSDGVTTTFRTDLNVIADISVTANFTRYASLSVIIAGKGILTSDLGGIDCPGTCSAEYNYNTVVTLTATPESGAKFAGWSGDMDCEDGVVTMAVDISCTAEFYDFPWALFLPGITGNQQ